MSIMTTPIEDIVAALEEEAESIEREKSELNKRFEALRERVRDLSKRLTMMSKPKAGTTTGAKRGRKPKVQPTEDSTTTPVSPALAAE